MARETTKSINPPITGIRFKIGLKTPRSSFVPLLPRTDVIPLLARLVAPDLAYLPPNDRTPSCPNLRVAASLPNRCAYLLLLLVK